MKTNNNLEFIFYTNRGLSSSSKRLVSELMKDKKDYSFICNFIKELFNDLEEKEKNKSKDKTKNPILKYVKEIYSLSLLEQKKLFEKLSLVLSENSIIEDIKRRIKYFAIKNDNDIESIYNELLGIVTTARYVLAKENKEFISDYNYFRKNLKFDLLIGLARVENIDFDKYYNFKNDYNEDYTEKTFYKQLKEIDFDDKKISRYANQRARTTTFLDELDILPSQENIINEKIREEWFIIHEDEYDTKYNSEKEHNIKAQKCFKETRRSPIKYKEQTLPQSLIEGKVIDLSNVPILGWREDWEEKYCE